MENPFEITIAEIKAALRNEADRIIAEIKQNEINAPGIDLDRYISTQVAAEKLGITTQALWSHKSEIEHVKRFGKIYFVKESLLEYMEAGRPEKKVKKIMHTRTGRK